MPRSRSLPPVLLALLCAVALSGCSPEISGVVGLTRTSQGEVAAVVLPCTGYFDAVAIDTYRQGQYEPVRTLALPQRTTSPVTVVLAEKAEEGELIADTDRPSRVTAWTRDQRYVSMDVEITRDEVDALSDGQVRFYGEDPGDGVVRYRTVPSADFEKVACDSLQATVYEE